MLFFLIKTMLLPVIIAGISIIIVQVIVRFFPRQQSSNGFSFAVKTLFISQIIFLLSTTFLFIISGGYIVFALGAIVFYNLISGIFSLIFSFIFYRLHLSKGSIQKKLSAPTDFVALIISIATLFGSFIFGGGGFIAVDFANSIAEDTGSRFLVNILGDFVKEGVKDEIYIKEAAKHGDVSVCDAMSESDYTTKNWCYREVDPEYAKAQEKCDLYTKFTGPDGTNYANHDQAKCVINKLAIEQYNLKKLDCKVLTSSFRNGYFTLINDKCKALETLQEVVLTKKPINCDGYSDVNDQDARAVCYSEFKDTPEHAQFCQNVDSVRGGERQYFTEAAALAGCPNARNDQGDILDVFGIIGRMPVYVTGEYFFDQDE